MILSVSLYSHPHTFIEVKPTLNLKDNKIKKFHIKWKLDEMTSMMLIMELDSNGNGIFEKDENSIIYENYFKSLKEYNYYMKITQNNQKIDIKPSNFQALIENGSLIYSFDIEHTLDPTTLEIVFFDELLYVGMMLEKDYITFNGIDEKSSEKLKKNIFGVN